jgi:hypothetical protein
MKKHTSQKQTTREGTAKETFAFYIGIDLGDKKSDKFGRLRSISRCTA